LLPFFAPLKLSQIDIGSIDAYSAKKQKDAAEMERKAAELKNQAGAMAAKAAAEGREMSREEKAQHARLCSESRVLIRPAIGIPTINKTITTLGSVLKYAVRSKLIDANPVRDVERPKVTALAQAEGTSEEEDVQVISKDYVNAFWAATTPGLYRMLFSAALTTEMRSGELFALQWGDIDWQANQILVRRVLTRHSGGWRFYEPKTKNSKRRVDVDPSFLLELKKWKLQQAKSDLNDLIFTNADGQPLHRSTVRKQGLLPALRRAGLPLIRFHHLRHTYASLLIDQGENPKYIQAQMGHSSINVTMDIYGHLMEKVNTHRLTA
jgi:integrase